MSIEFLVLGGGGYFGFFLGGGGGSADFIFMGARIFLTIAIASDFCVESLTEPNRQK